MSYNILHISDIHINSVEDANKYFFQLSTDLEKGIEIEQLHYVVISGDIGLYSIKEEYEAFFIFINKLVKKYGIKEKDIIIVPGNHDLNWEESKKAYKFQYNVSKNITENRCIPLSDEGFLVRNEDEYKNRFINFNKHLYKPFFDKDYPLEYKNQGILNYCEDKKIIFLGLNSCWEIDHHKLYRNRASINMESLDISIAELKKIKNNEEYLKIAVFHHPISGVETMRDTDFLEILATYNFRVILNGHIHKAINTFYKYDSSKGIHIVGAGTFGAPANQQSTGIPLQYNMLIYDPKRDEITVKTRKKEEPNGVWSADARWGDMNSPKSEYSFKINQSDNNHIPIEIHRKEGKKFDTLTGRFEEIDDYEFIRDSDFTNLNRVLLVGHTGKRIISSLCNKLEQLNELPHEVKILIRNPEIEMKSRYMYIKSSLEMVKNLREIFGNKKIDIRFYEAVPSLRGIMLEYNNKNRKTYLTNYRWNSSKKSKASKYAFIIDDSVINSKPLPDLFESWGNYYWGNDEIHTVIFDFDDTLVKTYKIQIQAWFKVIKELLDRDLIKPEDLNDNLQNCIDDENNLFNQIKSIFFEKQMAEYIITDLFKNDVVEGKVSEINNIRFDYRKDLMQDAILFDGVSEKIKKLSEKYNLAIISSTDVNLINKYLESKGMDKYFSTVLGKNDPTLKYEKENIFKKATLLLKLSNMIGIPLSRMVYIGDNDTDYLATRQIGIDFVEAKLAAKEIGKKSLISNIDFFRRPEASLDSYENDDIFKILDNISERKLFKKNK